MDYLDVKGLAAYIHRSPGAIRNLVMRRAVPFRKPAGRLVFVREQIDQWIEASEGLSFQELKNSEGALRKGEGGVTPGRLRPSAADRSGDEETKK